MRLKNLLLVLALSSLAACGERGDEQSPTEKTSLKKKAEQMNSKRDETAKESSREAVASVEVLDPPQAPSGKNIYWGKCMACHAAGVAGAPKVGDASLWQPRIAQGMNMLYKNAINGFKGSTGYMPPKGGYPRLSDDDVKAAVSYMVSMSQ
jgi:cytochrome c5